MPISRRLLAADEEVLIDVRPHLVFFFGPVVALVSAVVIALVIMNQFPHRLGAVNVLLAALVVIPALWFFARLARWFGISLVVTTTRLLYRHGVLSSDMVQLRLQRLADVHSNQNLIDRVIGAGTLVFEVEGDDAIVVDDVRHPRALQRVIAQQLDHIWGTGRTPGAPSGQAQAAPSSVSPSAPVSAPHGSRTTATPPQGTQLRPGGTEQPAPGSAGEAASDTDRDTHRADSTETRVADQLVALDDLRKRGIISPAEFAEKKAELLNRM